MQYKCIRGVVSSEGVLSVGDIVKLSSEEAAILMANGKIVPHHEEEIATNVVEDVVNQDPINRRGRKPKNYVD